ncbi:cytochrome o ubiquinol oxidase subunit IV [Sphingobium sp. HBC34]|uniref:Cytochrome bo(3) ubiquinol oxidase subunit 4 n=1 Tax=Sphingobium cyanobacteriorum TaxID=3063954 RepID=A0ABT8ZN34_9SPHN|nr:cytochrome o ubiquinol oxidase subunit IV [Sphingobium sp. HBC34]MDO7835389.1 cytochrome o ubiquinol oxidase subunit IV [Sphingobium sp. HBC34]
MSDAVHSHGHHEEHHDEGAHGSFGSYMIGFGLSVILTAIPFWLVMSGVLGNAQLTAFIIMAFAAVQVVVHMIYFLHMNTRVEGGWSFMAMGLTIVLVVITLSGSMWVMYHLNNNMMPHAAMEMHGEMSGGDDMGAMHDMNAMANMSEMP